MCLMSESSHARVKSIKSQQEDSVTEKARFFDLGLIEIIQSRHFLLGGRGQKREMFRGGPVKKSISYLLIFILVWLKWIGYISDC